MPPTFEQKLCGVLIWGSYMSLFLMLSVIIGLLIGTFKVVSLKTKSKDYMDNVLELFLMKNSEILSRYICCALTRFISHQSFF